MIQKLSKLSSSIMFFRKPLFTFTALLFFTVWFAAAPVVNAALPKHYQEKKIFHDALSIVLNKYITPVDNWSLLDGTAKGLLNLGYEKLTVESTADQLKVHIDNKETLQFTKAEIEHNAIALVESTSKLFDTIFEHFPQQDKISAIHAAITGMVATLEPNSYFIEPEDLERLQAQNVGVFGGIGLEITIIKGEIFVVSPYEDTPAFKAGLLPKDQIVAVEGQSTSGMRILEVSEKIRGAKGTKVTLSILREDWEKPQDITLVREIILHRTIKSFQLEPGFGYIRIVNFLGTTDDDFANVLQQLDTKSSLEGLIIDLRYNPGGLLNQSLGIADFFLNTGVIAKTDGRVKADNKTYYARPKTLSSDFPIVILINDGSASGSEVVAAALRTHHKAVLVGERSYGKGFIQAIFPTQSGGAMRITTSMLLTPDGKRIQDVGISPDMNMQKPALDYELPGHDETKLPTLTLGATRDDPAVKLGLEILKRSLLLQDTPEEELEDLSPEQAAIVKRFNGLQKALQEISRQKKL
jgi:carboxyl-terminal processing protease